MKLTWGSVALGLFFVLVVAGIVGIARREPLPADLAGSLVFVSNRAGADAVYIKRLPSGPERRLTFLGEPSRDPALSPDGGRVAFSVGGRIAVFTLATDQTQFLSLGVDWRDAAPAWLPDGRGVVVSSRRRGQAAGDLHLLLPDAATGPEAARRPLTETGADEVAPTLSPDGRTVVFVREDQLFRLDLEGGRERRLTGGFRTVRQPRFLPSGRVVFLWSEAKRYGIDVIDLSGKGRETLWQGTTFYRSLAPSPDGRFFAATFSFDLSFSLGEALKLRQTEEVRLLDAAGGPVATVSRSWRHSNHSPDWGP